MSAGLCSHLDMVKELGVTPVLLDSMDQISADAEARNAPKSFRALANDAQT